MRQGSILTPIIVGAGDLDAVVGQTVLSDWKAEVLLGDTDRPRCTQAQPQEGPRFCASAWDRPLGS